MREWLRILRRIQPAVAEEFSGRDDKCLAFYFVFCFHRQLDLIKGDATMQLPTKPGPKGLAHMSQLSVFAIAVALGCFEIEVT